MPCTNPNGRYVDWQWSPFWWVDLWGYIRTGLWFAQVPPCLYRASGSDPSCSGRSASTPDDIRGIRAIKIWTLANITPNRQMQELRRARLEFLELLEHLRFPFAIRNAVLAIL